MGWLRLAICQVSPVVGDLTANANLVSQALESAEAAGADLAVFPELVITGYPPEDLLLKPGFVADNIAAAHQVVERSGHCAAVFGFVDKKLDLFNAAAVCAGGELKGIYHKQVLPNYSVFDEERYFAEGTGATSLYVVAGTRVGISICEDAWDPTGPINAEAAAGAELVVNINASPYYAGRVHERRRMLATRAADASCALVYVNMVGGQDELVFDGASMVFSPEGKLVAALPQFTEVVSVFDIEVAPAYRKRLLDPRGRHRAPPLPEVHLGSAPARSPCGEATIAPPLAEPLGDEEEIYTALVVGARDYVRRNGFREVVVALSGGIDSSLVATIAADALGPAAVHGISMPSRYTSQASNDDAELLAKNLGIDYEVVAIEPAHKAMETMLAGSFAGRPSGLAEENIQSRLRGVVLMALSNMFGWLVLTTGNKSELAVGYSTLYGDTAGGFAVIKDVPKTMVYRLARWRNSKGEVIPASVLAKAPTAELRPGQLDTDSLPPYDQLDPVLHAYVEEDMTATELVEAGFSPELAERVVRLVDQAEYKRRQSPVGVRVSPKAFGRDRRMPITNRYR
jgi:NAD+ synthase (glutamine-hydrolysing)